MVLGEPVRKGSDSEDHPGFHFYDSTSDRAVAGHLYRSASADRVRVHFYTSSGGDVAEHPSIVAANGKLHMVWNDKVGNSNLRYSVCDPTSTVDCTIDGKKQFVLFQYNANPAGPEQTRVAVAERCESDANWTIQNVRTPDARTDDQMIVYGDPGMVLNQDERIAHVLLIEANSYTNGYDVCSVTDSDLFWYRKGYSACP